MKKIINTILCLLIIICIAGCEKKETEVNVETAEITRHPYVLKNEGGIEELDLAFLKLTNEKKNEVYSPLSIKYALAMLSEGAEGNSKKQIEAILDGYKPKKYTNSKNLSLANLFAIRNTLTENVSEEFKTTLLEEYDAYLFEETFEDPSKLNSWISKNTLGMIENYFDGFSPDTLFYIINALAIDMEWVNKVQNFFLYQPHHEEYSKYIEDHDSSYPYKISFNGGIVEGLLFAAVANKYDIISELGEETIRQTVKDDIVSQEYYTDLMDRFRRSYGGNTDEEAINNYLDKYIEDISANYGEYKQSTDFYYYDDDKVKVFAKDLKVYDGTQFQYIGIMPKKEDLSSYINKLNGDEIKSIINNLTEPSYDIFEEGYITEVIGEVPTFDFTYDLNLNKCLEELGVTDIFELGKADLSKIIGKGTGVFVNTSHKSTIDFSNDGIKAAAVSSAGGIGAAGYNYWFDVPIKTVDLTLDKPFLFLIRNKDTGEIWFVGSLYNGNATSAKLSIMVDYISIRKEPSSSSEKIGAVKIHEQVNGAGRVIEAEGLTWYELEDGGWVADDDGKWISLS